MVYYMDLWKNKQWLETEYQKFGSSTIAKQFNIDDSTIIYWLKKFNIPIRTKRESELISKSKHVSVDEDYFKNIDIPKKAYWLGFLMADGCIREYKKECYQLCFELAIRDRNIIEKFAKDINFNGKIYYTKSKARLIFANYNFCQKLMYYGIVPNKTGKESFSNIPQIYYRDFIRGYFDGDGSIMFYDKNNKSSENRIRARFHVVCANKIFLETIKNILEDIANIAFSSKALHKKYVNSNVFELETSSIKRIIKIYNSLYYTNCICMERKYNKFQLLVNHCLNSKRLKDIVRPL